MIDLEMEMKTMKIRNDGSFTVKLPCPSKEFFHASHAPKGFRGRCAPAPRGVTHAYDLPTTQGLTRESKTEAGKDPMKEREAMERYERCMYPVYEMVRVIVGSSSSC